MDTNDTREEPARAHLAALAKPPGSLGRLEDLAARLCAIQGTLSPRVRPRRLVVFAADHGVVRQGVSAWPSEVTAAVVRAIAGGGSASAALAAASGTECRVVDVGVAAPVREESMSEHTERLWRRSVAPGTADLSTGPAMTAGQWDQAWAAGVEQAALAEADGIRVLAVGEVGIGNTTSAACLAAWLLDASVETCVGPGAGSSPEIVEAKREIVRNAVDAVAGASCREALRALAGFELVAMAGCLAEAGRRGLTLVLDGVVATAAALMAERLAVGTAASFIAAHRSTEPSHEPMLAALHLAPFLDWGLRLGEGTGALALMPLLDLASALVTDVAFLDDVASTG